MGEKITIDELVSHVISEMRRMGYSEATIWRHQYPRYWQFQKYYRKRGISYYSPDVTEEYVQLMERRAEAGEILKKTFEIARFTGRRLNEVALTGTFRVTSSMKFGTKYVLSEDNEHLVGQFLDFMNYGPNTRNDAAWVVRKYLSYWENNERGAVSEISIEEARQYILKTAAEVKLSSLHNILLYLKYFYRFLKETGVAVPDCEEIFSYRVCREMPIQGYVTDEELESVLKVIDTSTDYGKKSRAIILLAANTGLRACDIIRIKLEDIDWRKGQISIVQAKTGKTVYVPLVEETGKALEDYILNARPSETGYREIFLRDQPPKMPYQSASSLGTMFKRYQEAAGIRRCAFDGKGFHGLRRRLAKKLIVSGAPLTMITQILGHEDIDSARQYLSLNTDNLKECALDLTGIEVTRRALL